MQIINITDCQGYNAQMRLNVRIKSIFPEGKVEYAGVSINSPIEAAGYIIDALDALASAKRFIIMVNIAPRGQKKYPNGAPFYFGHLGENIIVGTLDSFSLLKKFGLMTEVNETDVLTVCRKFLNEKEAQRIANSQFRSFEYLPLLAKWLWEKKNIPSKKVKIPELDGNYVWCTDRFTDDPRDKMNCKTTALKIEEIKNSKFRKLPFCERLADVPKGKGAIIRGSSGYKEKRFLEIVVQGGSAAKTFNLKVGSRV